MMRGGILILLIFLVIPNVNAQDKKAVKRAEKHAKKGYKPYVKRDYVVSLKWFTLAVEENPSVDEYHLKKGHSNYHLNNVLAAIDDFTAGIQQNSENTLCYLPRGVALHRTGDFEAAFNDFQAHTKIHEETQQTLNNKVISLMAMKAYYEAIEFYIQLIEMAPETGHFYLERALCFIETGQLGAAQVDLKTAQKMQGQENWRYQFVSGLYALRRKEFRKSISTFNAIISSDSLKFLSFPDTYRYLSNAYHAIGQLDSALIHINKAISHNQKPEYYLDRGNYYVALDDLDNALLDYSKAIELDATLTGAYNNRTFYIWFAKKDYQNAVQDMTAIINLDPQNAYAYNNRSYAYFGLKDFEHAFIDAFKSVELENRNPYVYKNLALLYHAIGEKEEASNAIKGALNWGFPVESDLEFEAVMLELGFTK